MAKSTEPKNKDLEQDILNEADQVAGSTKTAEASADLNEKLKGEAEKTAGASQAEVAEKAKELDEFVNKQEKTDAKPDPSAANEAMKTDTAANAKGDDPFLVPSYLQQNPPINQEEIDAIAGFLERYRKQPTHEEKAKQQESDEAAQLVRQYGKNHVRARKGGQEQIFTAITWQRMGGNKNQDGWREVVQTPPEVKGLKSGL